MSAPSYKKRLKELSEEEPIRDRIINLLDDLLKKDGHAYDRTIAVIGGSLIEHALKIAILSAFGSLASRGTERIFSKEDNAPLCTFGSRINMVHALDIIGGKTRTDLEIINLVRNQFAHYPYELTFEHPAIADACDKLKLIREKKETELTPKFAYVETIKYFSGVLQKGRRTPTYFIPGGGMITESGGTVKSLP